MEYLALLISAVTGLIEKFYSFEKYKWSKKIFFLASLLSLCIAIFLLFSKDSETKVSKAILDERHRYDSLRIKQILENQDFQGKVQLDSFEKILSKEYQLIDYYKNLASQTTLLQNKQQQQISELSKSKYQITDDFYCIFSIPISVKENELEDFGKRVLDYITVHDE